MLDEEQKKVNHEALQRRRKASSIIVVAWYGGRKPSCDAGDGAAHESGDSRKPAKWAVGGTVVINNYCVSPSKKEE
eukprot:9463378-Ditylum_brightwellii.AAC.1